MEAYEFTPWRDRKELLNIRQWLYWIPWTKEPDHRQQACSIVFAWKLLGHLPHAVESTALLIEAILSDKPDVVSGHATQLSYVSAFCRFVTGLVDSDQGARHRISMYDKAKQIGLPASFVELRHQATHEEFPSLVVLRRAVEKSLQWLWHDYWVKLTPNKYPYENEALKDGFAKLKERLRTILAKYKDRALKARDKDPQNRGLSGMWPEEACKDLVMICKNDKASLTELAVVLIEPRVMIPKSRELQSSMDDYFPLWDPLIKKFSAHQLDFLEVLTDQLAFQMILPTCLDISIDPYREAVMLWLERIFTSKTYATSTIRAKIDYNDILSTCMNCQNHWSVRLAQSMMEGPKRTVERSIYGERLEKAIHDLAEPRWVPILQPDAEKVSRTEKAIAGSSLQSGVDETSQSDGVIEPSLDAEADDGDPAVGGWQKWKGKWHPKDIGMV